MLLKHWDGFANSFAWTKVHFLFLYRGMLINILPVLSLSIETRLLGLEAVIHC